jgi:hypothetical protein
MSSWYSISITLASGGSPIFTGYFQVLNSNNKVTAFYETIGGSTNFSNNVIASNTYYGANYDYSAGSFGALGTNITYMNYYSNPTSPNYNSNYSFYNISGGLSGNASVRPLAAAGTPFAAIQMQVPYAIASISDPSCFNEGTKILTLNKILEEEYLLIENLRKGDLVKSYKHGYRKIDLIGKNPMINNPEKYNECMYKMEKTDDNGLLDDLIVTGGHAILVDDLGSFKKENDELFGTTPMIDNKYLLLSAVSKDFVKLENTNLYTYYHFTLENNGNDDERFGVWANGILTETSSKNHFINHKYTLL